MNKILKEYAARQADALAASIKLNQTTDQLIKNLDQLQDQYKNK